MQPIRYLQVVLFTFISHLCCSQQVAYEKVWGTSHYDYLTKPFITSRGEIRCSGWFNNKSVDAALDQNNNWVIFDSARKDSVKSFFAKTLDNQYVFARFLNGRNDSSYIEFGVMTEDYVTIRKKTLFEYPRNRGYQPVHQSYNPYTKKFFISEQKYLKDSLFFYGQILHTYDSLFNKLSTDTISFRDTLFHVTYGGIMKNGDLFFAGHIYDSVLAPLPFAYTIDQYGSRKGKIKYLGNVFLTNLTTIYPRIDAADMSSWGLSNGRIAVIQSVLNPGGTSYQNVGCLNVLDSTFSRRYFSKIFNDATVRFVWPLNDGSFYVNVVYRNLNSTFEHYDSNGVLINSIIFSARPLVAINAGLQLWNQDVLFTGIAFTQWTGSNADMYWTRINGFGKFYTPVIGHNNGTTLTALKPTLPREYTAQPQPNPTANRFTIPGVGREGVLSLVNASGRVVRQESFVPGSEVDISSLPKGLYLFRLVSEGAVTQGKVVRE